MENLSVNDIFDEEVTKISASLLPKNFSGDVRVTRAVQEQVAKLIDELGVESATAQGLNKVITSAEKLRNTTHVVYLLKDHRGNEGNGEIIGMLKVGRKHLFLFDSKEAVHEVEPLCVLDFYIVRDRQRMGFGRMLFDHMLHELEILPGHMAIDGPSDKMEQFLSRNYGIDHLMRQNNNFAVGPAFFDRSDDEISSSGGGLLSAVPSAAVGRFAAPKPVSAIANVIHGPGHEEAPRRSPSPAGDGPAGAPVECPRYPMDIWDDDWEEPSDHDSDFEACEFDPDQPASERRADMRALAATRYSPPLRYNPGQGSSPPALERPATLAVQQARGDGGHVQPAPSAPPAETSAELPAAGMPSGGASAAHSAAGTPAGRRDSQLTDRGYFDVKYYHNKLW